jgi:hypothetical protein
MYLPVLLVRDYGFAGWLVFTIPNVIGAGAMGWVLRQPGSAADLSAKHWHAAAAFSVVTILFHAFFVGWIIRSLIGDSAEIITVVGAVGFYLYGRRGRHDLPAAAALFCFSLAAFIIATSNSSANSIAAPHAEPMLGLVYLAPVCVFGFFLCPYLDLTFLRSRSSTESRAGVAAFAIGFGIFFLTMLLFTLWYARLLNPAKLAFVPRLLAWIIAGHMMLQTAYTVAIHTRSLAENHRWENGRMMAILTIPLFGSFSLGRWGDQFLPPLFGGETIYRLFMAFYGLIFPAYVWLCMIPFGRGHNVSIRRKMTVLGIAILVAAPMFWLGFIANQMIWLVPGLVVVLIAKFAIRGGQRLAFNSRPN